MQADPVMDAIKQIVVEDLDVNLTREQLDETLPLFEGGFGFDSVVVIELISFIERRFAILIGDDLLNLNTFRNLGTVADVVRDLVAHRGLEAAPA